MMDFIYSLIVTFMVWDVKSLLLFAVVFILTADYIKNRQSTSFPPGPRQYPFVGNLFTVDHNRTHESMTQLAKKYGDVYSLRFCKVWLVVINGFKVYKEALANQHYSMVERPILPLIYELNNGFGLLFSNGNLWKQQRRFALSTLRNFGLGKKAMEPVILEEFTHLLKDFQSYQGKPFNPRLGLNNAVSNIICTLVFGHRFEYTDEKFRRLISCFEKSLQIQISLWSWFYNSFPWLAKLLPGPRKTLWHIFNITKDFIKEEIKEHKQNWDPSDIRDYIDRFLNEMQMNKGHPDNTFDDEALVMCVMDLFVAGSETTTITLSWAFLYMAKHPEIQAKVQAEIDREIGQSRQPSMEDRVNLPYTEAVISEVQRISNAVPLSLPYGTSKEIQLGGYTIPKGVPIIPNLTSVLFDKNEWETPFTFNPKHFLNEEGKFVKPAAFIPFSAGKRLCPGEGLAKMELFLFFTSLMQHFTLSMPDGVEPVMDSRFGINLSPCQFEICATSRSD